MSKKLARIVLIAQKPLQIKEKLFYKKSLKYDRESMQELKCHVYYCNLGQTLVFVKNMSVLNLWC